MMLSTGMNQSGTALKGIDMNNFNPRPSVEAPVADWYDYFLARELAKGKTIDQAEVLAEQFCEFTFAN